MRRARASILAGGLVAFAAGGAAAPAAAQQADPATPETVLEEVGGQDREAQQGPPVVEPQPATVRIRLNRVKRGKVDVGRRVEIVGKLRPFVEGEKLKVLFMRRHKVLERAVRTVKKVPNENLGRVKMRTRKIVKPSRYKARVIHQPTEAQEKAKKTTEPWSVRYPSLNGGSSNTVALFNDLLNRQGYGNAPNGRRYNQQTRRAVLAFRKVNGMARVTKASSGVFRKLADGRGRFKPRYPGAGRHVETDLSRQVMALIDGGKARYTYHISSGAPATPSDTGRFRFYRKDPGYNSIGMYYSVYYNGGEATHGYKSVPNYPASHGCLRNPIPDSRFIYNWIRIGNPIWVYR